MKQVNAQLDRVMRSPVGGRLSLGVGTMPVELVASMQYRPTSNLGMFLDFGISPAEKLRISALGGLRLTW